MDKERKYKKYINAIIAGVLIFGALAIDLDADLTTADICTSSIIICNIVLNTLSKISVMLGDVSLKETIFLMLIICFYYKTSHWKLMKGKRAYAIIPAVFFSLNMIFGYSYMSINSWNLIFRDFFQLFMAISVGAGYYLLFRRAIEGLFLWVDSTKIVQSCVSASASKWNNFIYGEKPKLKMFLFIILCWMPHIISRYPGCLSHDARIQLAGFFGIMEFTSHHPPFHTIILGSCIKLGRIIASDNVGLFIYVILQTTIMALLLCFILDYLAKKNVLYKFRTIALFFYGLCPFFPMYATAVNKDTLYLCFFAIFFISILQFLECNLIDIKQKKNWIILTMSMIFVSFLRNEGIVIVECTMFALIVWNWKGKNGLTRGVTKKLAMCTLGVFLLIIVTNKVIFPSMGIAEGSKAEMLSIPFQQTARYVSEFPEDVTTQEGKTIEKILDYGNLSNLYDPTISDPVKSTYNDAASSSDLKAYFKVWFKQMLRHPDVYIEATLNNNYALFYIDSRTINYFATDEADINIVGVDIHSVPVLKNIADVLRDIINFGGSIPIYNLLENMSTYTCLFILVLASIFRKKQYPYLILMIPLLLVILARIAGPAIIWHDRYRAPFIFIAPILICLLFLKENKNTINEG